VSPGAGAGVPRPGGTAVAPSMLRPPSSGGTSVPCAKADGAMSSVAATAMILDARTRTSFVLPAKNWLSVKIPSATTLGGSECFT
jgi:hypothetical protein